MGMARAFEHVLWPRVHLLTANVKRRNLLRRTGFLRAAPDFMDSHICHKKKKKKSVKVSYQHLWAFHSQVKHRLYSPNPSFPQAWHHFSQAVKCRYFTLPTAHFSPPATLVTGCGKGENPEASARWVSARLLFPSTNIFLVYTRHIRVIKIKKSQSIPTGSLQSSERFRHKYPSIPSGRMCILEGCRIPERTPKLGWEMGREKNQKGLLEDSDLNYVKGIS